MVLIQDNGSVWSLFYAITCQLHEFFAPSYKYWINISDQLVLNAAQILRLSRWLSGRSLGYHAGDVGSILRRANQRYKISRTVTVLWHGEDYKMVCVIHSDLLCSMYRGDT